MAEYTVTIALPEHKRGDRWPGIPIIGPVLVNALTPAGALERVRMTLRHPSGALYQIDSNAGADAPVTLTDAAAWQAAIPVVQDFVALAGKWSWDMEFWEAGNTSPQTFYQGVLTVYDDIGK